MAETKTNLITSNDIINDVIKRYPRTIGVFNQFHVDSCCGGGQSIEETGTRDGVDIDALVKALNEAARDQVY